MSQTRTLRIDPPNLSRLYLGAAASGLRAKLPASGTPHSLPELTLVTEHSVISPEQAEAYRLLVGGQAFDGVHRRSLPSVLLHIAAFPVQMALMSRRDFPLPLMGLVHLANEVHHHRPVVAGEPLQIRVRAQSMRAHRRGTQVDIAVDIYPAEIYPAETHAGEVGERSDAGSGGAADTAPLWSGISTYLSRGTYLAGRPEGERAQERPDFRPPRKTAQWRLSADTGREYAAVSGDYNPIHLSVLSAKALGMPRTIAHGMYSAARVLEGREPEQAGHRWSISFGSPVTLPGTVAVGVEQADEHSCRFTGWDPRRQRLHFQGELILP